MPGKRLRMLLSFVFLLTAAGADATAAQLTATWSVDSADIDGFVIERAEASGTDFVEIGAASGGARSFVDGRVAAGTTYCYRVQAFNDVGSSPYSDTACGAAAASYSLAVVKTGRGTGQVRSTPAGVECGSTCSAVHPSGTAITLEAVARKGSVFEGWSGGGCTGTGPCTVVVTSSTVVSAGFARQRR
jgi:hypothetical protein